MPRGNPSRVDAGLIQMLAERGLTVSPYQLERWRAAGLLPRNRRHGLGRGNGSVSELDEETVEQAAALARVAKQGSALPGRHVLERFASGRPVAEAEVRATYTAQLDRLAALIAADTAEDDAGWQAQYDAAERLSRRAHLVDVGVLLDALLDLPGRLTATDREQREAVRAFTQAMAHGGDAPLEEMAAAFALYGATPGGGTVDGVKEMLREAELSGSTVADEIARALSLERFQEVLEHASYGELRRAATVYFEAWAFQSLILMAGMWSIAADANGDPETVASGFREIDRSTIEHLMDDPGYRVWGSNLDPFLRNLHDTLVLGSLGLLQLPELLRAVEGYRDALAALKVAASAAARD